MLLILVISEYLCQLTKEGDMGLEEHDYSRHMSSLHSNNAEDNR